MSTALAEPKNAFFDAVLPSEAAAIRKFDPEDFVPLAGTVLIVMAPKQTETEGDDAGDGRLHLPDTVQANPNFARVAAVPLSQGVLDSRCPVRPGDIVVFNPGAPEKLTLGDRDDLYFVRYCDGPESEITGFIPKEALDKAENTG